MPKKRHIVPLPETDADLHYPESMPLAERESLAGESQLTERRKQKKQGGREGLKPQSIQRAARRKSEQF
jgi:hypothetical protein